jgi:formate-dependent nitrite reductase membrane component NrfD
MAALYIAIGMILGGISAIIIMAMFFVAKRADDKQVHTSSNLAPVITHQEIT